MVLRRLLLMACGVGAVVALVATISANILHWSDEISVLDAPQDQVAGLTQTQLNDKLLSGALRLKTMSGAEKATYFLTSSPMLLAQSWAYFFVPSAVAAFLGGLLVSGRRAA